MQNPSHRKQQQRRHRLPRPIDLLPGHVVLRLICHDALVGGLIGPSGSIISQIRRETSCIIHCGDLVHGSDHRVIIVAGPGSPGRRIALGTEGEEGGVEENGLVSGAQEAVIRVFERMWKVEAGRIGVGGGEGYCGLLANTTQIGAVVGKGGKHIMKMRKDSEAHIRILPAPLCAAKDDELIQITGAILAVKKALIAVTGCLQDCPPMEKDLLHSTVPVERAERASHSEICDPQAEFFPHLSSYLPPLSEISASSHSLPKVVDGDSNQDCKATQQEVSFKLLCSNGAAGSIIGKKGTIVRALQNQTGASIVFAAPITMSGERVVTVSALENLESWYSPAQNALVLVFARSIEHDIQNGRPSGLTKGTTVTARLLVASDVVCCLSGNGGRIDSEMTEMTGADICILEGNQVFDCASENDVVVQITGEYKSVQNAMFQVTSKLRDNIMPSEVLNEVSGRDSYGRGREIAPPRSQNSAGPFIDSNRETSLTRGMDKLGLSISKTDPPAPRLNSPQNLGREYKSSLTDHKSSSTTFSRGSELERSLHFLLPREVLNEVGARSSCEGVRDTPCSGLYSSLSFAPDSSQETVLNIVNDQLGLSDRAGHHSSPGLHLQQTVRREHCIVNSDIERDSATFGRSTKLDRKKTAIVANTTVELIVSEDILGSIYGEDGNNLARLRQISGAQVEVRDPSPGESEGMVVISGSPDQTRIAQSLLQAFILDSQ